MGDAVSMSGAGAGMKRAGKTGPGQPLRSAGGPPPRPRSSPPRDHVRVLEGPPAPRYYVFEVRAVSGYPHPGIAGDASPSFTVFIPGVDIPAEPELTFPWRGWGGAALHNESLLIPIHCAESVLIHANSQSLCKSSRQETQLCRGVDLVGLKPCFV